MSFSLVGAGLFMRTLPAIGKTIFATAGGREGFNQFAVSCMKLYGPKNERSDYFIRSAVAAGALIDVHWLAQLFTLYVSNVGGMWRETIPNEDGTTRVAVFAVNKEGKKVEVVPGELDPTTGKMQKPGWLAVERHKACRITHNADKKQLSTPTQKIFCDIEYDTAGIRLPKRAGITPVAFYMTYNKVKAFVIHLFTWSSFQSVASTYVPLINPNFSLFAPFTNGICKLGGEQFFTPAQWDTGLRFVWQKADIVTSGLAYGLQGYDAGRRLFPILCNTEIAKSWFPSLHDKYVVQNNDFDMGRSAWKEGTKLGISVVACGLYGWMAVTKQESLHAKMAVGALRIGLNVIKELRKSEAAKEIESYNWNQLSEKMKGLSRSFTFGGF